MSLLPKVDCDCDNFASCTARYFMKRTRLELYPIYQQDSNFVHLKSCLPVNNVCLTAGIDQICVKYMTTSWGLTLRELIVFCILPGRISFTKDERQLLQLDLRAIAYEVVPTLYVLMKH